MPTARVFIPQEALESWLSSGSAHVVGESLFIEGHAFSLESALRFMTEVASGDDGPQLLGRVKTLKQLETLGGEHYSASVVLGDNAYEVIEGFLAQAVPQGSPLPDHEQLIKLFAPR